MKTKYFWIFVIIVGAILMILGSAVGSQFYTVLLEQLIFYGFIGPEFVQLVSSIMVVLGYIAYYGGYSVLVAVFLILIKWSKVGRIIITIATGFGILGLLIYGISWAIGYFSITLDPTWQTILDTVHGLFTFSSGIGLTGTATVVVGKFFEKKAEKADEKEEKSEPKSDSPSENHGSKFCPECGASLPAKANFCNKCGKNFD